MCVELSAYTIFGTIILDLHFMVVRCVVCIGGVRVDGKPKLHHQIQHGQSAF